MDIDKNRAACTSVCACFDVATREHTKARAYRRRGRRETVLVRFAFSCKASFRVIKRFRVNLFTLHVKDIIYVVPSYTLLSLSNLLRFVKITSDFQVIGRVAHCLTFLRVKFWLSYTSFKLVSLVTMTCLMMDSDFSVIVDMEGCLVR